MAIGTLDDFFKAFVYFVDNGLDPKLAKEFAEKVTGIKVKDEETLKAFTPEIKKSVETKPKGLITRKERGDLLFINSKISDPQKNKMVLQGLDGTTESIYSQFRIELEAYKNGLEKNLKFLEANNKGLGGKDLDNVRYNMKIIRDLENKVNQLADDLVKDGKEPEKIYQNFRNVEVEKRYGVSKKELEERIKKDQGILQSMDTSMEKIKKLLDEMEDIKTGKAEENRMSIVKRKYQGKGYGPSEGIYRTLTRQFLADEIEAGRIETTPAIYNAMRQGGHPFIDPIKIFRHHYGDDKFDVLENYIDQNYSAFGSPGIRYPGRFEFRKMGLLPINKKAPGKTYAHYSLPDEINAEIEEIDRLILDYQAGKSPMIRSKEELLEAIRTQNEKRARLVKIKNEITPKSEIDLTQYSNEDLNRLADEGNQLQSELSLVDEDGSSTLPYQEFQEKSARLEEIAKIIEEAKKMPEEFFDQQPSAEVIPIKKEGILTDIDNTAEKLKKLEGKTFKGVELYGDETFDELKYIDENGVHPRDLDPEDGFAKGGIVSLT
jgi:hypothetical protein